MSGSFWRSCLPSTPEPGHCSESWAGSEGLQFASPHVSTVLLDTLSRGAAFPLAPRVPVSAHISGLSVAPCLEGLSSLVLCLGLDLITENWALGREWFFTRSGFFPSPELRKLFPRALLDPCVPRHTRCCGPSGTCCLLAAQAGKSCPVKQASWASHRCRHSGYLHERNQIRSLGRNH